MIDSPDSRDQPQEPHRSFAGEGVDDIVATDHACVTDLDADIAALGFARLRERDARRGDHELRLRPLQRLSAGPGSGAAADPRLDRPRGRGAAGPGLPDLRQLQPVAGADRRGGRSASRRTRARRRWSRSTTSTATSSRCAIDTSQTPPASVLNRWTSTSTAIPASQSALLPARPGDQRTSSTTSPRSKLWNGYTTAHQNEFLDRRIGIWMNLLNQGLPTTAIADTDTHEFHNLRSGGARTWTPSSTDDPSGVVDAEIGARGARRQDGRRPGHLRADAAARHRRLGRHRAAHRSRAGGHATRDAGRGHARHRRQRRGRSRDPRAGSDLGALRHDRDLPQRGDAGRADATAGRRRSSVPFPPPR